MLKWLKARPGLGTTVVLLLLASLYVSYAAIRHHYQAPSLLPAASDKRTEQPRAQFKEQMREVTNWPGTDKRKELHIDYTDGRAVIANFREDGTIERVRELFAVASQNPQNTERRIKSDLKFAPDGKRILQKSCYRDSGALEISARTIGPKIFEQVMFGDDGQTPVSILVWVNDQLTVDQRFDNNALALDGRVKRAPSDSSALEYTGYRSNLTRAYVVNSSPSSLDIDFFGNDGSTRVMHATVGSNTEAQLFTSDGHLDQVRSYTKDTMTVQKYHAVMPKPAPAARTGAGGNSAATANSTPPAPQYLPSYGQVWHVADTTSGGAATTPTYVLQALEEMNDNGTVTRRVEFDAKGSVSKVTEYTATGVLARIKSFTDGMLDSTDIMDAHGEKLRTVKATGKQAVKEQVDPQLLLQLPFDDPRPFASRLNIPVGNLHPLAGSPTFDPASLNDH